MTRIERTTEEAMSTQTTHTPGPIWNLSDEVNRLKDGTYWVRVFELSDADIDPANIYGATEEECLTRAHLIAAAPEMHNELECAVAAFEAILTGKYNPEETRILLRRRIANALALLGRIR